MDAKTALVHVMLNPEMVPTSPGTWDSLEVVFMKPAYFCRGFESSVTVPTLGIGEFRIKVIGSLISSAALFYDGR